MVRNMALDLVLRTLMSSPEFNETGDKNWSAVARLVPGTTSQEVSLTVFILTNLCVLDFKDGT